MYTPIELVSTNVGQVAYHGGGGGGVTDHGYLHGLGDNDHPQYMLNSNSTVFMPVANNSLYQLTAQNSLSLGTAAAQSFYYTSNSSLLIAVSNSSIYAISNHTHTGLGGALSDHSHGSISTASISGTDIKFTSNSSGLSVGIPKYITTAYGGVIQGSGTYTQNTGTIQFANSNAVSFGLNTNGVMTASIPAIGGAQTGISAIAGSGASSVTNGTIQFGNANGMSFGLNGATMTGSYTVPGNTVFSNSNNVEFGLNGSTVTALALFAQSTQTQNVHNLTLAGNTTGTLANVSSGTLTLAGGNNITLSQVGNAVTIIGSAGASNSHNITVGGNTTGTLAQVSSGTFTIAGGNNITLSQVGNAITISGANIGGAQTGISGIAASNTTYTSGSVIWSAQNNITIGSYVSSNSQYVRLSVGNYLTTAAQSDHTHGGVVLNLSHFPGGNATSGTNGLGLSITNYPSSSFINVSQSSNLAGSGFSSQSTVGTDIKATQNSLGLNLAIPKYLTTAVQSAPALMVYLQNLTGAAGNDATGITLSLTGNDPTNFINTSEAGSVYFGGGSNVTWASSVSGGSTSIMMTAGGGTGGGAGMGLAFGGNTTGTMQTLNSGTVQLIAGSNITLSQAGSNITILGGGGTVANNWATATKTGSDIQVSTGVTNTIHYGKFITTYTQGTGVGTQLATTAADITFNSNGLSFDGRRYAGTGFTSNTIAGQNVSASVSTDGLKLWVPNYLTTQTLPSNTVSFVDGGGVTWGTSTGSISNITVVTATVAGGGAVGTGVTISSVTGSSLAITLNTAGISILRPNYQTQGISIFDGTNGIANGQLRLSNSNNVTLGLTGATLTASASYPVGSIYFADSNGFTFSSSVNGVSTTIFIHS
jgi:hypothetical protein